MATHLKLAFFALAFLLVSPIAAKSAPLVGTGINGVGSAETNWQVFLGDQVNDPDLAPVALPAFAVDGAAQYPGAYAPTAGLGFNFITPYSDAPLTPTNSATNDPLSNGPVGSLSTFYTYTLADFTSPLIDIAISWASDNGARFYLNGTLLEEIEAPSISDTPYSPLLTFLIAASEFATEGNNLFQVVVENLQLPLREGSNPTALAVGVSAVPLPPAALLFGSALLGLNWLRRRKARESGVLARA